MLTTKVVAIFRDNKTNTFYSGRIKRLNKMVLIDIRGQGESEDEYDVKK